MNNKLKQKLREHKVKVSDTLINSTVNELGLDINNLNDDEIDSVVSILKTQGLTNVSPTELKPTGVTQEIQIMIEEITKRRDDYAEGVADKLVQVIKETPNLAMQKIAEKLAGESANLESFREEIKNDLIDFFPNF